MHTSGMGLAKRSSNLAGRKRRKSTDWLFAHGMSILLAGLFAAWIGVVVSISVR